MTVSGPTLRDIHVPPVPWWPPAIGWWLLATLALIAIVACMLLVIRRRGRRHPRRAVQRELDALSERFTHDRDVHALAAELSKLLRRIALVIEPDAAARSSDGWRAFLEHRAPGVFDDTQLATLLEAPYRPDAVCNAEALLASTRAWCERALRKGARQPA